MKISQYLIVSAATILVSCEDVVQVKLDEGAKLYVIDAFVNDLPQSQQIRITTSDAYFANREAPPVSGASVTVEDLTAGKTYHFGDHGNGFYMCDDTLAVTGHSYRLSVEIDGTVYTALTTQCRKASIDSIAAEATDTTRGFTRNSPLFYRCTLYAKDATGATPDYYWIKTFRNDSLLSSPTDINVSIDGTNGAVTGIEADSTEFTPPVIFLGFRGFARHTTCEVQIHSITRDCYNFFTQAIQQVNNGGLFATTPENVKTNIVTPGGAKTKAVGWFNVAGVTAKKRSIP